MYDDLYCKVFIDTNLSYEELFSRIMNYVDGKKESFSYVVADWCDMFIQKNKEYNVEQYIGFYRFCILEVLLRYRTTKY